MTPETPPPDDLADHLKLAARHLRMSLRLGKSAPYTCGAFECYRHHMALAGSLAAGMTELAQVWVWVTERPLEFKAALRAAHCLRAEAWSIRPSAATDAFDLAVGSIEVMLRDVEAKLEDLDRG